MDDEAVIRPSRSDYVAMAAGVFGFVVTFLRWLHRGEVR